MQVVRKERKTLPTPRFVVFYNGDDTIPERSILRLSDSFENKAKDGCLEVEALLLDVNIGKNQELMASCRYLQEYATFVGKVKEYKQKCTDLDMAIDRAIAYCIDRDIMRDILLKHKAEVARLIFREFDEAEYMRLVEKDTERQIAVFKEEIALQKEQLSQQSEQLSQQEEQLSQKDEQLEKYKRMLEEHGLLAPDK